MEAHHGAHTFLVCLFVVRLKHEDQTRPVHSDRRFDHVRGDLLIGLVIKVVQVSSRGLRVLGEIEVATVGHSLQLTLAEREVVHDVHRPARVVRTRAIRMFVQVQFGPPDAVID